VWLPFNRLCSSLATLFYCLYFTFVFALQPYPVFLLFFNKFPFSFRRFLTTSFEKTLNEKKLKWKWIRTTIWQGIMWERAFECRGMQPTFIFKEGLLVFSLFTNLQLNFQDWIMHRSNKLSLTRLLHSFASNFFCWFFDSIFFVTVIIIYFR
jgi:hypothetical protein